MDPVADMLSAIKNAQAVGKETVFIRFSNLKYEIAKILEKNGFIKKIEKKGRKTKKGIEITLSYKNGASAISGFKKISKPGQKIYKGYKEIKRMSRGYGIVIVSTSRGVMTDKEAGKQRLGGEVLCKVW